MSYFVNVPLYGETFMYIASQAQPAVCLLGRDPNMVENKGQPTR